jgi:hypothetical protein
MGLDVHLRETIRASFGKQLIKSFLHIVLVSVSAALAPTCHVQGTKSYFPWQFTNVNLVPSAKHNDTIVAKYPG